MKKLFLVICLMVIAAGAKAQFEQGKWIVNPSLTGLNLSHSSIEDTSFGIGLKGGAFLVDNVALLVDLTGSWEENVDMYGVGVSGRYYFENIGIYTGVGLGLNHWKYDRLLGYDDSITNYSLNMEVGYAFFLSKNVTIEPAVYCNLSLKDSDYTKYGLRIGFGFYF